MARVRIIFQAPWRRTRLPPRNTAVPTTPKKTSKKRRLAESLAASGLTAIGEPEWRRLLTELAPVSESYLRQLLRDSGVPVVQPFGGIRQKTFEELEESLIEMEGVYREARASGDRARAHYCRSQVIQAKDHARLAAHGSKNSPEKRAAKEEMVQWMLVWLDDPALFEAWVKVRKGRV
jgi:hypothetical protein